MRDKIVKSYDLYGSVSVIMRSVRPSLFSLLVCLAGALGFTSCTVKTGSHITKVNPYHLKPGYHPRTDEQMIDFEYRRKIHGAVTAEDFRDRYGNYFTVYWRSTHRGEPVTVKLHYRQAASGPKILVLEKTLPNPRPGVNSTNFEIIGDDYAKNGAVTQWKATMIQGGNIVDEFKSYLWQ